MCGNALKRCHLCFHQKIQAPVYMTLIQSTSSGIQNSPQTGPDDQAPAFADQPPLLKCATSTKKRQKLQPPRLILKTPLKVDTAQSLLHPNLRDGPKNATAPNNKSALYRQGPTKIRSTQTEVQSLRGQVDGLTHQLQQAQTEQKQKNG